MLTTRIIPCLDVDEGRVVKGIQFRSVIPAGNPVEMARDYAEQGADEIIFLDIGATCRKRDTLIGLVEAVSDQVFVPLTVGGGIRSIEDMRKILNAGADKVAVCTAAVNNPGLLCQGAGTFGSQCLVLSVDARKRNGRWNVFVNGGRQDTGIDTLDWVRTGEKMGAGEILLNSIDRDGTRQGYDLDLIRTVTRSVKIPVIASGGAGTPDDVFQAIQAGGADAVLVASLVHYRSCDIPALKKYLKKKGVPIR